MLAAAVTLFVSRNATGCSCAPPEPPSEAVREAAAVFVGEAIDANTPHLSRTWLLIKGLSARWFDTPKPSDSNFAAADRRYTFRVERAWKGPPLSEFVIITGDGGGDCGIPFELGKRYLVYAYDYGGFYYTGMCTRTTPLQYAKPDLDVLAELPTHAN
jgi:hypothetical protein